MANLQATSITSSLIIQKDTYMKLGTAYFSSGGSLANFAYNAYNNGSWQNPAGTVGIQLTTNTFNFLDIGAGGATAYFSSDSSITSLTTFAATSTKFGSGVTNTVGIGAAAGANTTDGKLLINAGGTGKPAIEVTNCNGDSSTSTTTYSVDKGWLGVKIGTSVGATAADTGTWYIKLWG